MVKKIFLLPYEDWSMKNSKLFADSRNGTENPLNKLFYNNNNSSEYYMTHGIKV